MSCPAGSRFGANGIAIALTLIALIGVTDMGRAETTAERIGDVAEISVGADLKISKSDEKMPDFSVY